jgi:glycosyltransferase involved in cell wall biosynthesis
MIVGIDASNIRMGGGVTHLVELLRAVNPERYGFDKVVIWSSTSTLDKIEDRAWLIKRTDETLNSHLIKRAQWQRKSLEKLVLQEKCDILFVPGGSFLTQFKPIVTMSQNLLPFDWQALKRYGLSLFTLKWLLLRYSQARSFKKASGTIFLTQYAQDITLKITGRLAGKKIIVAHGLDQRFFIPPRKQKKLAEYNAAKPFRFIYVSTIEPYKHQWNVVEAVANLKKEGLPVALDLYGSAYSIALKKLNKTIQKVDPDQTFIKYHGLANHENLQEKYIKSDMAVFASSCETFGQILIEGMAAGLPTACSNISAMPELLDDAGFYFDPLSVNSIAKTLRESIALPELRMEYAEKSYERAKQFSWDRCANETFSFLQQCLTRG